MNSFMKLFTGAIVSGLIAGSVAKADETTPAADPNAPAATKGEGAGCGEKGGCNGQANAEKKDGKDAKAKKAKGAKKKAN